MNREKEEGLSAVRGIVYGLPVAIAAWTLIAAAIVVIVEWVN